MLIIAQVSECVNVVLHECSESRELPVSSCQTTDELCTALEAVFVHGLRETFLERMTSSLAGGRSRKLPEPNYWPTVMLVTHSATLQHISQMSQIHNDVGKCRAWLRLSLNEGLLTSYLKALHLLSNSLSMHYESYALLRHSEHLQLVERKLVGLEAVHKFNLATNCSLFNKWPTDPLVLAGLLVDDSRSSLTRSAAPAQDAAAAILKVAPSLSNSSEAAVPSLSRTPSLLLNALDPDSALDLIVKWRDQHQGGTSASLRSGSEPELDLCRSDVESAHEERSASKPLADTGHQAVPQSFISVLEAYRENSPRAHSMILTPEVCRVVGAWSDGVRAGSGCPSPTSTPKSSSQSVQTDQYLNESPYLSESIQKIHRDQNNTSVLGSTDSDVRSEEAEIGPSQSEPPVRPKTVCNPSDQDQGEAEKSDDGSDCGEEEEAGLAKISTAVGLSGQQYRCADCSRFIGMLYGRPRMCAVDARYYCQDCHSGQERMVVPARVLHNWDFTPYPVSERNGRRLQSVHRSALYNVWQINAPLYELCSALDRVRRLRTQVVFLYAFLRTCRAAETALATFKRTLSYEGEVWRPLAAGSKPHLWLHVHLFSLCDLQDVGGGFLETRLRQAICEGRTHVLACQVCSQKGFICEVCHDSGIVYPFDVHTTACCRQCGSVFHKQCWQQVQWMCSRCERRKARCLRQENSLMNGEREDHSPLTAC